MHKIITSENHTSTEFTNMNTLYLTERFQNILILTVIINPDKPCHTPEKTYHTKEIQETLKNKKIPHNPANCTKYESITHTETTTANKTYTDKNTEAEQKKNTATKREIKTDDHVTNTKKINVYNLPFTNSPIPQVFKTSVKQNYSDTSDEHKL